VRLETQRSSAWLRSVTSGVGLVFTLLACGSEPNAPDESRIRAITQRLAAEPINGASLGAKQLVLTFDDGPATTVTTAIATFLKNRPAGAIPAAFFVNGACIASTPLPGNKACPSGPAPSASTILAQIVSNGHLVANQGTTHRDFVTEVPNNQRVQEISETDTRIASYVGYRRHFFRAAYGSWTGGTSPTPFETLSTSLMNKYVGPIGWDIAAVDTDCWQQNWTTRQCGEHYLDQIRASGKGVVRFHDPSGNYPNTDIDTNTGNTVELVKYIVPILESESYEFKALSEVPAVAAALPPCDGSCATCSGPNANQCASCTGGRYLQAGTCKDCSTCDASSFQASACTPTANTVCTACDASCNGCAGAGPSQCRGCNQDQFLSPSPTGACHACKVCGSGFFQSAGCTATTDATCGKCHATCTACAGPDIADCGKCPEGFHIVDAVCVACTKCGAGKHETGECTTFTDRTCEDCPAGTSSFTGMKECSPCLDGTFADMPGSASCKSCNECNDGDRCTKDSCDVAKGCAHEDLPNCSDQPIQIEPPASIPPTPPLSSGTGEGDSSGCNATSTTPTAPRSWLLLGLVGVATLRRRRARAVSSSR
jgi:MYXO-CTERM domain-containing protein